MKRNLTAEQRTALVELAEDVERRARACDLPHLQGWVRAREANRLAVEILQALHDRHDASLRASGDEQSMTLMGVRATSVRGPLGLLHNWVAAARRKAGAAGAPDRRPGS